jgi:hypothetical protein
VQVAVDERLRADEIAVPPLPTILSEDSTPEVITGLMVVNHGHQTEQLDLVSQHREIGDRRRVISHRHGQINQHLNPDRAVAVAGAPDPVPATTARSASFDQSDPPADENQRVTRLSPSAVTVVLGRDVGACTSKSALLPGTMDLRQVQNIIQNPM